MAEYDNNNIFAKIVRGELPAHKVFEDDASCAFLDIMPRADGHTLVIPKRPSRNLLDIELSDLCAVMATVQRIARAGLKAFQAQGVTIQQFNEPAGGQVVFHTHIHVIPRRADIDLKPAASIKEQEEVLVRNAERLRAALAG